MLSERTIINGLILIAGMILGPYLIVLTFEYNQLALLSFAGLVFLFCVFFVIKDGISVFPFIAASFSGDLNFLPFGLTPDEVFSQMVVLYYLINYIALKRKPIDGGPRPILFPMLVLGGIVLYHDHQFGLLSLGGSQIGSRPGLLILLAIAAYLCGINIPSPSEKFISRIPLWCLFGALLGSLPVALTTYIPSLAPIVYLFSGNINMQAYIVSIGGGDSSDLTRNAAFLGLAAPVQLIILAYFPISTWWRPSRWIYLILSLLCLIGVLMGGYRNGFVGYILTFLLGTICYLRLRILLVLPLLALGPLALILVQNNHFGALALPQTVQRSLSFLPGEWDTSVKESTESSNEFRDDISRVYIKEYLAKSPWLGKGFAFDPGEVSSMEAKMKQRGQSDPEYYQTKMFLATKNFHTGWISLYDAVGIIGSIAFIYLNLLMVWMSGYLVFRRGVDMKSPLFPIKVWLFTLQGSGLVGYFTTFGNFSGNVVGLCGFAVILFFVRKFDQKDALRTINLSPSKPSDATQTFATPLPAKVALR